MMDGTPPQQPNLTRSTPDVILPAAAAHAPTLNGQTTPPSPLTDASSAPTLFASASASTPNTDLTSLPSDVSKLSLGPAAKKAALLEEGPGVTWPYSQDVALNDIPGIAFALDTFLKSHMVESEEYCHRKDPRKCVASHFFPHPHPQPTALRALRVVFTS